MKSFAFHVVLIFLTTTLLNECHGQGFFNQKGAWIKNQLKQIALWEIYIKDIEKGYEIARQGLNTISDIKNGDFHLHLDHFDALMAVNPDITKYSKAVEILLLQSDIKKLVIKSDDDYINSVFTHLIDGCHEDVDQLNKLLSPGNYDCMQTRKRNMRLLKVLLMM